jgi:hypothetical protein
VPRPRVLTRRPSTDTDQSELLAIAKAEVDRLYAEVGEAIRRLELRAARREARDALGIIIAEAVRTA